MDEEVIIVLECVELQLTGEKNDQRPDNLSGADVLEAQRDV